MGREGEEISMVGGDKPNGSEVNFLGKIVRSTNPETLQFAGTIFGIDPLNSVSIYTREIIKYIDYIKLPYLQPTCWIGS